MFFSESLRQTGRRKLRWVRNTMNKGHTFEYTFTVFTPTYNRAHLLVRLYESLKQQTFRDFEWVIVDDGSSDATPELVKRWQTEASFPIRYFWQPNSGKHVAYNRGLLEARGFLFADIDSDDFYVPEALERFYYYWSRIPGEEQEQFAGVIGHFADMNSKRIIGTLFPKNFLISDGIEIRLRYRVKGDKIGANRIELLRQFPFPEDLGRFVPEALVGNRIYQRYKQLFFNEVVAYKTYLRGGLSDRNVVIRASSPKSRKDLLPRVRFSSATDTLHRKVRELRQPHALFVTRGCASVKGCQ